MKCQLCGNELEKLGKNHFSCRRCGLGTDGKATDLKSHLKFLKKAVILAKVIKPNLSNSELTDFVQGTLHKVEHHPLDKHDYCIYCNKSFKETV